MTILIIGASGFIGSSLLETLRNEGIPVEGTTSRKSQPHLQYLDPLNDTGMYEWLDSGRFDVIVNCASKGVIRGNATTSEMRMVNADLPKRIAEVMRRLEWPCKLVHLSSSTEQLGSDAHESDYARFKKEGTMDVLRTLEGSIHTLNVVRIHNVYASKPLPSRFITEVAFAAQKGEEFRLQFPNRIRDFVHISDVLSSLRNVIVSNSRVSTKCEVGTGVGYSLGKVADMIYELFGSSPNLIVKDTESTWDAHPYEVAGNVGFDQNLGQVQLPEGLEMLMETMS